MLGEPILSFRVDSRTGKQVNQQNSKQAEEYFAGISNLLQSLNSQFHASFAINPRIWMVGEHLLWEQGRDSVVSNAGLPLGAWESSKVRRLLTTMGWP